MNMLKFYFTFILTAIITSLQAQTLNNVATNEIVNISLESVGQAWGDINNDGYLDLYLISGEADDLLFLNDGDGSFTHSNPESIFNKPATPPTSNGVTLGDYDNDGDLDIYVAYNSTDEKNALYQNDGDGTFTLLTTTQLTSNKVNSTSGSWADFNNDGHLDLIVGNYSTSNTNNFITQNSDGTFNPGSLVETGYTQSVSWCDIDNDGSSELFITQWNVVNQNLLYQNNGSTLNTIISPLTSTDEHSEGASWADYDNDGDFDVFITTLNNPNLLFQNDGTGNFTQVSDPVFSDAESSYGSTWGDYNNDGWIDLFVTNDGANNFLYENDGMGSFIKVTTGDPVSGAFDSKGCNWIDYDKDGDLDLYFVTSGSGDENKLFQNSGSSNGYLAVSLVGTISNASAIGAKVKIQANIGGSDISQMRQISAQTGFRAQDGLLAHFGLGDASQVDVLQVEWPSGIVQTYTDVAINQYLEIIEKPAPVIPANLAASAVSDTQIDLTWDDNGDETGYIIERSTTSGSGFSEVASLSMNVTSHQDNGLTASTEYFYRIKAFNESGDSGYSAEVSATTLIPATIEAPTDLLASTISSSEISLSWTDNSSTETVFKIERSESSGGPFTEVGTAGVDATSFDDTGLNPETIYYYQVLASDGSTDSDPSNEASATTNPLIFAPSNFSLASTIYSQIDLSWTDNSGNETGFVIERSTTSGSGFTEIHTTGTDEETYSDTDAALAPETSYYYRIRATDGTDYSAYTAEETITTAVAVIAPTDLLATTGSHERIELSWTDNSDNETGFVLERALASGGPYTEIGTVASGVVAYQDTGLDPETTYYYQIKATDGTYDSDYSAEVSAATSAFTPVIFSIDNYIVQPAEEIVVPVTVSNFVDILTTQFTISWDPAVLSLVGTESYGLAHLDAGDFGTITPGILTLAWDDIDLSGRTLTDNSTLFEIRFSAIGTDGQSSTLTFPDSPTAMEVANSAAEIQLTQVNEGLVELKSLVTLSGQILSAQGDPVENAEILVKDAVKTDTAFTDNTGNFIYSALPGSELWVAPFKANDQKVNNGITTLDIALLRRHVLGMLPISNTFDIISADVNNTKSLSTLDISIMRTVILGINNSFGGELWKFIPESFSFVDPEDPFPYDTLVHIGSATNMNDLNFTGVKLGDINGSWDHTVARVNHSQEVEILIDEYQAEENEEIVIPIRVKDFHKLIGYQFTLNWDPGVIEFLEIADNPLQAFFSDHQVNQGRLTFAWDEPTGKELSLPDYSEIIQLRFKVHGGVNDETNLEINSQITQMLAYNTHLEEIKVVPTNGRISIPEVSSPHQFKLYPNYPNPLETQTTFRFDLPEASLVKVKIYNSVGQIVDHIEQYFESGMQQMNWDYQMSIGSNLKNGIYYYQIEAGEYKETSRMIIKR